MARRPAPDRAPRVRPARAPLTPAQRLGLGSAATLVLVAGAGMLAGILLDRLLNFDDALDAGGEWDEGGGIHTRWD